jgi:LysM repeat protein
VDLAGNPPLRQTGVGGIKTLQLDAARKEVFHSGMKRILFLILFVVVSVAPVFGQDTATQQQIDKLYGMIQDVQATQELQGKRLDALAKQISELSDKVSTPQVNDSPSRDDLKKLAEQVQEIDKKRQDDRDLILKELKKLGDAAASAPVKSKSKSTTPTTTTTDDPNTATPAVPQKGYEYIVQKGDTLPAIAKAYREQGVKVTTAQIIKANPNVDPNKLFIGKKIFIPDPNAK